MAARSRAALDLSGPIVKVESVLKHQHSLQTETGASHSTKSARPTETRHVDTVYRVEAAQDRHVPDAAERMVCDLPASPQICVP